MSSASTKARTVSTSMRCSSVRPKSMTLARLLRQADRSAGILVARQVLVGLPDGFDLRQHGWLERRRLWTTHIDREQHLLVGGDDLGLIAAMHGVEDMQALGVMAEHLRVHPHLQPALHLEEIVGVHLQG